MPEDTICPLWKRLLLLYLEMVLEPLVWIVISLSVFKVVVFVTLAISTLPIFLFIMSYSFQEVKRAGIWTFPYNCKMVVHIIPRRLHSCFGMLIDFMYTHQLWSHPISSKVEGYFSSWSVMLGLPLINATSPGWPTTKQGLELICIRG